MFVCTLIATGKISLADIGNARVTPWAPNFISAGRSANSRVVDICEDVTEALARVAVMK